MSVQSDLVDAINNKRNVRFIYDGYLRECSPHALGIKGDKINCLVYQFAGMSSKGPVVTDSPANWRCMDMAKIEGLQIIDGAWHSFDNHSQPATCIDQYIAQVAY